MESSLFGEVAPKKKTLTSEANGFLHLHPLRAGHGDQRALLPPHQPHGDHVTHRILPGLHSNNTAETQRDAADVSDLTFLIPGSSSTTSSSPLQVRRLDGLVADGTLGPALVAQRQVVQHARPAEDVPAAGDTRRQWGVQADGARRHLMTVDALDTHTHTPLIHSNLLFGL